MPLEEIQRRYKAATNPHERIRWNAILLLSDGRARSRSDIANDLQRTTAWLCQTIARYNTLGPDGLKDRRPERSQRPRLLNEEQHEQLDQRLQNPPDDGGLWTGQKVAAFIAKMTGQKVDQSTGWWYLKRLGYSLQQACQQSTPQMKTSAAGQGAGQGTQASQNQSSQGARLRRWLKT